MIPLRLVIFDCDGVLVDSERLAASTGAALLAEFGWALTADQVTELFVGRSEEHMHAALEEALGRQVPEWPEAWQRRLFETYRADLEAVPGIHQALSRIDLPSCVASSGSHQKMDLTLAKTGLLDRFAGHIYSADDVERAKPAPDVFLYAAASEGVDPAGCVVVEDSNAGVRAARAAGMEVLAYSSGVTPAEDLRGERTTLFSDMAELPGLLRGLQQARGASAPPQAEEGS